MKLTILLRIQNDVPHLSRRRFILDYVFWTNFFQGSVYFRLVKTMYFGLSPGRVVFYTSLKECTLGQAMQRLDFALTIISFLVFYTNDKMCILAQKSLVAYFGLFGNLAFQPNNQCKIHHLPPNHAFYAMYFELCILDFENHVLCPEKIEQYILDQALTMFFALIF